jgi:hypothetical protein
MFKNLASTLSIAVLCAAAGGCMVADPRGGPAPAAAVGTLAALWRLQGSAHANSCVYYQVDRVHVVIADGAGAPIADVEPVCEDFGVSFDLPAGSYSSGMTLLAVDGSAMSDTVLTDVRVLPDTKAYVDVDFPAGSIH